MGQDDRSVIAAIPARWGSTRFPGKPLALLAGEPMIVHVVRRASEARTVDAVLVATDDERVAEVARGAGAEVVMTGECASGTDRVAEAVLARAGWEIVINLQGDEPRIAAENIDTLVAGMRATPEVGIATLCRPLDPVRVADANVVKVVRSASGRALYFSRSPLPFPRNLAVAQEMWRVHLGIYGFRRAALAAFVALPPSRLEQAEALEQLRALENGIEILVLEAPKPAFGVDTPEDLAELERMLGRSER